MAAELEINRWGITNWISRETEIKPIILRLLDEPGTGVSAWARTTSGLIALLLFVQFATGILLAFHYVPATANAYTTVAFIELAVRDGAWIRSMHYHSSVLLPIALAAHILQMIFRLSFTKNSAAWIFGVVLLGLVLGAAATGYALPWDARAINGVNIAISLAGNTPIAGGFLKSWMMNGNAISTLTLSRFYGLHVWVVPMLILTAAAMRVFIFGKRKDAGDESRYTAWARSQFTRNALVIGLAFLAISLFSVLYPAPFGPQAAESSTYLPRPGPQFLWLFEMQKYTDGTLAAVLAMGFPSAVIGGLIAAAFLLRRRVDLVRIAAIGLFAVAFGTVGVLTATAIYQDHSDAKISEQLAKQELDESKFRASVFEPQTQMPPRPSKREENDKSPQSSDAVLASSSAPMPVPSTYEVNCAKCHGERGEGTAKFPELVDVTTRDEDQLTPDMILAIINDPKAVGRSSKMPSYKNKLDDDQKQELVEWIKSLSPKDPNGETPHVQTASIQDQKQ